MSSALSGKRVRVSSSYMESKKYSHTLCTLKLGTLGIEFQGYLRLLIICVLRKEDFLLQCFQVMVYICHTDVFTSCEGVVCTVELGAEEVSLLERCPHFRGWYVQASMELGPEDVTLIERCPHFRGWYVQASMELEPEEVSLLERCPHFRGWYVQTSVELEPEDVRGVHISEGGM